MSRQEYRAVCGRPCCSSWSAQGIDHGRGEGSWRLARAEPLVAAGAPSHRTRLQSRRRSPSDPRRLVPALPGCAPDRDPGPSGTLVVLGPTSDADRRADCHVTPGIHGAYSIFPYLFIFLILFL